MLSRKSSLIIVSALFIQLLSIGGLFAQEKPEVFVQTGHTTAVSKLAISENDKYLVSLSYPSLKIWDIETAREMRTLKVEGTVYNAYFLDDEKFVLMYEKSAEIYTVFGERLETIPLPAIQESGKKFFSKNRKLLLTVMPQITHSVKFYDVRDGSEFKVPEQNYGSFPPSILALGYGYFGVFYDEYARVADFKNIGKKGYVIYNEELKVLKRGVFQGSVGIGEKLKVDRELKYLYECRSYGDNPSLVKYNLDDGSTMCSVPIKGINVENFDILPDGRLALESSTSTEMPGPWYVFDTNVNIVEFLDNGLYKVKNLVLHDLADPSTYAFGKSGLLIEAHPAGVLKRYNSFLGQEVAQFGATPSTYGGLSYANGRLLDIWQEFTMRTKEVKVTYNLWNLRIAGLENFSVTNSTNDVYEREIPGIGSKTWYLSNPQAFYSKVPKEFYPDDFKPSDSDLYSRANGYPYVHMRAASTNDFSYTKKDNYIAVLRLPEKTEVAKMYLFTNGEWIVITPEGYFNASPNGAKLLNVRVGKNVYAIDNFYEKFYSPAYVASILEGKKVAAASDIRKGVLPPPTVKIVYPGAGREYQSDTLNVTVCAKDAGGGVDEIRLFQNGKAIGEDTRGMKSVSKANEVVRTFSVILVDGPNSFRATAFSKDRSESDPSEVTVSLAAPRKEVSLHVLAVGINTYKNPALSLNYAEPDARSIAAFFKNGKSELFKDVEVSEIYSEQATKPSILASFTQLQKTNPQDVVLIYLAGHGENINDKWYFIPYELTYPERETELTSKAISSDDLKESINKIKAQKILVLIDACKSGAVLLAFRGFEDRKALSQLSRSTGVHIVAASTKNQFASEVKELGHGVFTYTLLGGLSGKAAGAGEIITVRKLMGYIEEQLPELTKKYKQEAQYPVVDSRGMDFPLVKGRE